MSVWCCIKRCGTTSGSKPPISVSPPWKVGLYLSEAPMNKEFARDCFRAASVYVSKCCPEELEWVRGITPELLNTMSCPEFLEEYCWVVYASGFRVSVLAQKFRQLKAAFCDFDIDRIC